MLQGISISLWSSRPFSSAMQSVTLSTSDCGGIAWAPRTRKSLSNSIEKITLLDAFDLSDYELGADEPSHSLRNSLFRVQAIGIVFR